jgi:hypothetical protein
VVPVRWEHFQTEEKKNGTLTTQNTKLKAVLTYLKRTSHNGTGKVGDIFRPKRKKWNTEDIEHKTVMNYLKRTSQNDMLSAIIRASVPYVLG